MKLFDSMPRPNLSTLAGAALAGVGAWVATSHIPDPGLKALVWGIAAGAVIAVPNVGAAFRRGQTAAVLLAVVSIFAAEVFGVVNQAERLLGERAHLSAQAEKINRARTLAEANEKTAKAVFDKAVADEAAERKRGGCKTICRDLGVAVEKARIDLAAAQEALKAAPAAVAEHQLAATTGLPVWLVDLVPAVLASTAVNGLAFALLAFGHGAGGPTGGTRRAEPEVPAEAERTRQEQALAWIAAYEKKHGHPPRFSVVRSELDLPKATAHRYLKRAAG